MENETFKKVINEFFALNIKIHTSLWMEKKKIIDCIKKYENCFIFLLSDNGSQERINSSIFIDVIEHFIYRTDSGEWVWLEIEIQKTKRISCQIGCSDRNFRFVSNDIEYFWGVLDELGVFKSVKKITKNNEVMVDTITNLV